MGAALLWATFGLGLLLLLLLLTTYPGPSKAQHRSHGWYPGGKRASSLPRDPQHPPRPPEKVLGTAAQSPGQIAHTLPSDALAWPEDSVPWKSRTMTRWLLRGKQHLVQTLLISKVEGPHPWPLQGQLRTEGLGG
ncbi:progonadoliberin-2 [Bos indicus x Bos taurus]|uniref:progonadoliberin-2 n=1 Tax=Bos indicus x Bos taurus TaxID=30522 RepID=UPI00023AD149|nr:PREDICTED: progonadoliberin-2 [Bos indicus]XP_027415112.1 progonadoliberin-2 [Bos indicus x Bos taurus]XP_061292735.1 progonadoliberin-2 [Bos javanicus]